MFHIRPATPADADHIHQFIVELAIFEKEPEAVEAHPAVLAQQLAMSPPPFECLIAEVDGTPVGFALFFHNYSTWKGRRGLYLEDLYVQPGHRGHGIGRGLLERLARIAVERDCARFEWAVLDWNEPAIALYESLGARPRSGWTTYQLTGEPLKALGAHKESSSRLLNRLLAHHMSSMNTCSGGTMALERPKTTDPEDIDHPSNLQKDPSDWVTGEEPMTDAQSSYLKTLSEEAGEPYDPSLTKAQASRRIDELQAKTGRGKPREEATRA